MCGICGFLSVTGSRDRDAMLAMARRMAARLEHRGPDDQGAWVDARAGVALGHRRLAILDLSPAGMQPMVSSCGRFVLVYNGEIYNFQELRSELVSHGHRFQGHSDTEVLLAACVVWGVEASLQRANGMFAFALWDTRDRVLTLARDRVGKKPLYYGWFGNTFVFGSELKALRAHPDFDPEIDRDALGLFIQYAWIPGPYSIYTHVRKLPAGSMLTVRHDDRPASADPVAYWSARKLVEEGNRNPFTGTTGQATEELHQLLADAVHKRMIADVSLGALLSAGVDSSTVVALMQAQSNQPVKTFTIGFHDPKYNEAEHARHIARHLGTDHTELYVRPEDTLEVIPKLARLYDEPFADPSQLPSYLVFRLARRDVTVALSGDGGDELFAGYHRYHLCSNDWQRFQGYPLFLRRSMARGAEALSRQVWRMLDPARQDHQDIAGWRRLPAKWEKRTRGYPATDPLDLFVRMRTRCRQPDEFVRGAGPVPGLLTDAGRWPQVSEPLRVMMYLDFAGYLADNNLVKVDRASMGVSLEVRNPLLDYRIAEFAWRLPTSMLLGQNGTKHILRRVLAQYIPRKLTERPKRGFGVPVSAWLRGPLREWAASLLDESRLQREGFLHPKSVQRIWRQHVSGWQDHRELLWNLLMFQAWHEEWANSREQDAR